MLVITKKSIPQFVAKEAGGKGANLYFLSRQGMNVPEWFVFGKRFFNTYLKETKLDEKILQIMSDAPDAKTKDYDIGVWAKKKSVEITNLMLSTPFPNQLNEFFIRQYKDFNKTCIAVRSSAIDEDSATHSFAGQLSSFLYLLDCDAYLLAIKECWASGFSERGLVYRVKNGLTVTTIQVAVVVQEMIDPDKSGVAFSCDPINENPEKILINSVYGVGEGLVSGLLDADTYMLNKSDLAVEQEELVEKKKKLTRDPKGGHIEVDVATELIEASSLSKGELLSLGDIVKKIEDLYHFPQDIEWAIKDGKIYLLQARPVTTPVRARLGTLYIWDNSNIVESYGGLTMPLTFGFARYVYHQVYLQFCEILMVPWKHIRQMDFFLQNMLGLYYGRVYYNLLNWYKLTSILPGYKYNRNFMETMMGTNEALQDEIAERVKPPSFQNDFGSIVRRFFTGFKFFYFHLNIQNIVDKFLEEFHPIYNDFRRLDYSKMESSKIYSHYQRLEREMLWKWHAPIINDFLCMIHYGIFKKLTEKWLSHLGDAFHNDLMAGNGNLESAEPTKRLIKLAYDIEHTPGLKQLIQQTENQDCMEALRQSSYQDFKAKVDDYIDRFGFRCMSEMKLEQKDLHQDPSLLFVFCKNLINSGQTDLEKYEEREKEIRSKAESLLEQNLSGWKSLIYNWSLKHARKAVTNRENTRFCRTRIYGVVRAMFYGIGKDYTSKNIIDCPEDLFYLSLEELKGSFEGHNSIQDLRKVIEVRRSEYQRYGEGDEPAPRFHTRGPNYWNNQHFPVEEVVIDDSELQENQMRGLGCCPGVVIGTIKVIMGPEDDLTLNGEILVTHRTDPGWIPLYPSASGLLVERGGLLSHSAIVAREMGLPTIVSIKGLTKRLKSGMKVRFDGETGLIEIIEE
jgi:rifampicin phosphotransferase